MGVKKVKGTRVELLGLTLSPILFSEDQGGLKPAQMG